MAGVIVAAGVIGLLAGVAFSFLGGRNKAAAPAIAVQSPAAPASTPATDATDTPEAPARLVATLPAFQLADRDGQMRSLQDWSGHSLIVNFWATWCAPCRREIPLLQEIARERGDKGFKVIGIAVDFRDKVLAYADEMKIDYPLLIGEQDGLDAAAAFGVPSVGFPFTVFSDNQGRVIAAHLGELHRDEAELILDAVAAVNAGQQEPETARAAIEAGLAGLPKRADAK
jgi:thiol-disulfide isomerase/thioredoxin